MPAEQPDGQIRTFLSKHLKSFKDASTIKLRRVQKAVAKEFGKGLFMPRLSELVRSIRPDYTPKPAPVRKKTGKRRGPGRPPGVGGKRGPGRPAAAANGSDYLVKTGRKTQTVRSHARLQVIVNGLLSSGTSVGRIKVFRLVPVPVSTRVEIGQ